MLPKIVSLFCGAGGLDLGFRESGFEIAFAVDQSAAAIRTHRRNFPGTKALVADLVLLQPTGVMRELEEVLHDGEVIGLIGGPPCQGFSRANTAARPNDPRNKLPMLYLEIVEALQAKYDVSFVLFENVLGIQDAKHSVAFRGILTKFRELGLVANVVAHSALDYGVAQTRKRVIITGFKEQAALDAFHPRTVEAEELTVRSVIGDLPQPAFFSRDLQPDAIPHHPNHWTMRPMSKKFSTPGGVRETGRSFRRLDWNRPSPTVAYGHREIHVHPEGKRRISIFEAMLLQGFPESFVLEGTLSQQVEQVSNAVPPPLAKSLARAVDRALQSPPGKLASPVTPGKLASPVAPPRV